MEKKQDLLKIQPILPQRVFITKEHSYGDFIKRHYRVLPKLDLKKSEDLIYPSFRRIGSFESINYFEIFSLFKIFRPLKYIREVDLSNLFLRSKPYSPSKMIYFAKRMSNAHVIRIPDFKKLTSFYKGQSELWVKYTKRARVFGYSCGLENTGHHVDPNLFGNSNNSSTFLHLIRHQSQIKDITIQFYLNGQFLPEAYFRFEKYPPHLERLSLKGISYDNDVPTSMYHLKSLKHFEMLFDYGVTSAFIFFLIQQLTLLPNLQSLSLSWSRSMEQDPSLVFPKNNAFRFLTTLKLCFQIEIANLASVFKPFTECPLHHLKLQARTKSKQEFIQIVNFIASFQNLERLQLKIHCWDEFQTQNLLAQLLHQIDTLPLLTNLSVSILPSNEFRSSQKVILPFTQLFTRPVLLKSFKLFFHRFPFSNKRFLQLLKALERHASTLRKLMIDIGEIGLNQNETKTVLSFIKSLPKIRSLQFQNLHIFSESFLRNLVEIIYPMPYLEKFALGKLSDQGLSEKSIISAVERTLKKRGLRNFFCYTSRFYNKDGFVDKSHNLNLATIQKINPYLKQVPDLPIYVRDDDNDYDFLDM